MQYNLRLKTARAHNLTRYRHAKPPSNVPLKLYAPARALLLLLLTLALAANRTLAAAPLDLDRTIPLKNVPGRIDHMAIDLNRNRLFVAELQNGTLDVIDLSTGQVAHRISNLEQPQGVAYAPAADILAIANGGDGSVRLFHAADLSAAATLELGEDADNTRLDPRTGSLIVGYGSGGLAIIDPATAHLVSRIPLPAHPEGFQLDPGTHRAFVNLPGARQIAIVDIETGQQTGAWHVPGLRGNFPMALNTRIAEIAVMYRSPSRLLVIDTKTGTPAANLPSCSYGDDLFFDEKRHRIYATCGDGNLEIWQQDRATYRHLSSVKTSTGARTSLFVPELDRLFVAARAGLGSDAAILVFRPVE